MSEVVDFLVASVAHLRAAEREELVRRLVAEEGQATAAPAAPVAAKTAQVSADVQELEPVTFQIIGCAMQVHSKLGSGHREDVYQRAMEQALAGCGFPVVSQQKIAVYDKPEGGQLLGYYIPDLIVANAVVVELKALPATGKEHLSQVISYLAVTNCPVGLLLNFGQRRLDFHRVTPPKNIDASRIDREWLYLPGTYFHS